MKKCISLLLAVLTVFLSFSAFSALPLEISADNTVTAWAYEDGMENWDGSPNKGDESAVTQILFCPTYNGEWNTKWFYPGLFVTVTMRSDYGSQTFDADIATIFDGGSWGICRVEPCLLDDANRFIPVADRAYTATFTLTVNGEEFTFSPDDTYVLREDPIVPDVVNVTPMYDVIENIRGKTCFITGFSKAALLDRLQNGSCTLKVVIKNETQNEVYTIPHYFFDTPDVEIYKSGADSFLRLAVCEYGIIPEAGDSYTVSLEVYDSESGDLICRGSSSEGAFDSFNNDFLANGAIVPEVIPHSYEEDPGRRIYSRFDLNGSQEVDISDVTALLNVLSGVGSLSQGQTADFDASGDQNIEDVTYFLNCLCSGYEFVRNEADNGWTVAGSLHISGEVVLPESYQGEPVTQISKYAFENCAMLEKLTVPASVTWIGRNAFSGCGALGEIVYGGKPSTFYAGSVVLPSGCTLTCLLKEDLFDSLNFGAAQEIGNLGGYDGILRVKTSGELLFSPTLTELRNLISNGASYDDFVAYLRFSDDDFVYPTVTVDPKKSKGGWVDFFLQGMNIDCGFCPTAGVTYSIEFALARTSAPLTVILTGVYEATAGANFADSVYYAPTPAGESGEERTYLLRYKASAGGSISGPAEQYLASSDLSETVVALPDEGYQFIIWSDGVADAERSGESVARNTTLIAYFAQVYDTAIASMFIYTESGQPILHKEYENATIAIRGAANDKYNVTLPTTIKGRGNSSWNSSASQSSYDSKNSYSIKLLEKAQLLGVGDSKNKNWVLNSNKFDASQMRNYLIWQFADLMGTINYAPDCTWVQLYINNEYRGMYMLSEKIDTGKDRVNVKDDATGDPDKGYLIELDFRGQNEEDPWFDVKGYGPDPARNRYDAVEFVIKSDIEGDQDVEFIRNYVQRCHDAIMAGDRAKIEELVDLPSLIDMYIIEELSKDCDAGRASFYVCKDRGGKLFCTAPWDFDFGFGTYGPATSTTGLVSTGSSCCTWFASLITRSWFREAVLARMEELNVPLITALCDVRDTAEILAADIDRNAEFWNIYGRRYHSYVSSQTSSELHSCGEHIQFIYEWTVERWKDLKSAIENY